MAIDDETWSQILELREASKRWRAAQEAAAASKELDSLNLGTGEPVSGEILLGKLSLPEDYRRRLVSVSRLPLELVAKILRSPAYLKGLTPRQFEEFTADLIDGVGFTDIELTPSSGDGGKDIIASKVVHGVPISFYFECKKYAEGNKVQLATLRSLLGVVAHNSNKANVGVLVTTSTFTAGSLKLIASDCRLDGKDYQGLMGWIDTYRGHRSCDK